MPCPPGARPALLALTLLRRIASLLLGSDGLETLGTDKYYSSVSSCVSEERPACLSICLALLFHSTHSLALDCYFQLSPLQADIRQLDFAALRRAGYRGAVFDKDNCLTIPHDDTLVPKLRDAWRDCRETFGSDNVLIVSNSAGTYLDPGALQAESVRHKLGVPVLFHPKLKPSYGCARSILSYFSSLPSALAPHELVFIGDRIFTDVVLAHRLGEPPSVWQRMLRRLRLARLPKPSQPAQTADDEHFSAGMGGEMKVLRTGVEPLAVWTTGVWKRESMGLRWVEHQVVKAVERWIPDAAMERRNLEAQFIKSMVETKPESVPKSRGSWVFGGLGWMVSKIRPRRND